MSRSCPLLCHVCGTSLCALSGKRPSDSDAGRQILFNILVTVATV